MSTTFFVVSLVIVSVSAMLAGYSLGYNAGVKDTESRWHEAIARKHQ